MQVEIRQDAACMLLPNSHQPNERLRPMAKFTDSLNRDWEIKLTASILQAIKEEFQISLTDLEKDPMRKLENDPIALQTIVLVICRKQIDSLGISQDEFLDALPSPPDEIIEAVEDSIVNFYPSGKHSHVREVLMRFREMSQKTDQLAMAKMKKLIEDPKSIELIGKRADREIAEAMAKTFGPDTELGT
jgi:hydrogenase maturation factor HypE